MKSPECVAEFKIDQYQFYLKFHHNEFILALQPRPYSSQRRPAKFDAWLSFADEPTYDDVNESINAFAVMCAAREAIVRYVDRYAPSYFYFHASTPRKAKIYPRFAKRLQQDLADYCVSAENGSFYFYRQH